MKLVIYADDLRHLAVLDQHAEVGHARDMRAAGGIGNAGEPLRPLGQQRLRQVVGRAGAGEAALTEMGDDALLRMLALDLNAAMEG